ncbi:uncharacterized protein LOC121810294 isoform X2 [Salvia splendens]|uniref:uncharacterized protein LOC121810294 isoform X2 n=1 Tax=Salvia splendens TaxID=180675 RepID=UPI001C26A5EA|nr:uncharacterized protein LOC121810294 isoform X2 [Salvia splendens]
MIDPQFHQDTDLHGQLQKFAQNIILEYSQLLGDSSDDMCYQWWYFFHKRETQLNFKSDELDAQQGNRVTILADCGTLTAELSCLPILGFLHLRKGAHELDILCIFIFISHITWNTTTIWSANIEGVGSESEHEIRSHKIDLFSRLFRQILFA